MKNPELIYRIVRKVSGAIDIPTTVKMRAGVSSEKINAVECALAAEEGGATIVTVHGRTREEMYTGLSNAEIIKNVKNNLHIPVIANGDVTSGAGAVSLLRETGADGIMIGRGAIGNPFLFSEIISAIKGEEYCPPSLKERVDTALTQEARKQIALYLRSFRGAARIRAEINRAESFSRVECILRSALE